MSEFAAGDRVEALTDLEGDPRIESGTRGTVVKATTPRDANVVVCFDSDISHAFRLVPKEAIELVP